uniref:Regulatory protein zeste n=1 Tax=Ixodes ricinus TaxID=34613 RepID=A0A6B0UAU5_IXORI
MSQASTSQTISRTQTPKMTLDQQMELIRAIGERKQQILEKFSSTVTWRTKRQAWEDIVNDISFPRSARQPQEAWRKLVKKARDMCALFRGHEQRTGESDVPAQ